MFLTWGLLAAFKIPGPVSLGVYQLLVDRIARAHEIAASARVPSKRGGHEAFVAGLK